MASPSGSDGPLVPTLWVMDVYGLPTKPRDLSAYVKKDLTWAASVSRNELLGSGHLPDVCAHPSPRFTPSSNPEQSCHVRSHTRSQCAHSHPCPDPHQVLSTGSPRRSCLPWTKLSVERQPPPYSDPKSPSTSLVLDGFYPSSGKKMVLSKGKLARTGWGEASGWSLMKLKSTCFCVLVLTDMSGHWHPCLCLVWDISKGKG